MEVKNGELHRGIESENHESTYGAEKRNAEFVPRHAIGARMQQDGKMAFWRRQITQCENALNLFAFARKPLCTQRVQPAA